MPRPESVTTSMRVVLVVVALLAALGAAPPVASAQTGVMDACVQQAQGLTRIVGATETCRQNEIRVQWNVVGPKGDQGPQGPPGVSASASALGGTWTGRIFSIGRSFELPYVYTGQPGVGQNGNVNVPLQPPATRQPFWNIPAAATGVTCGAFSVPCAISWSNQNVSPGTLPPPGLSVTRFNLVTEAVDPNHQNDPSFNTRLAETSSLSASLQLTATGSTITGSILDEHGAEIGSINGIAVSNEFFLLRILVTHSDDNPACPPPRMQAFASIRTDLPGGPRLNITGSGGTPGAPSVCEPHHDFFSGGFRRS